SQSDDDRGSEDRDRIVSIENVALSNPTLKNRDIILTAKFTAVTFRQEDQPAAPAPGAPGQPAPPGAGKPPAPAPIPPPPPTAAPPPLPSATTPAGAKARAENAVEKGDARNRNAAGVDEAKAPPAAGSDRLKGGL